MSIQQNKNDRELYDLCQAEGGERFWELVRKKLESDRPLDRSLMTRQEIEAFERHKMEFGAYADKTVKDIPRDYLEYISGFLDFYLQLSRYLRTVSY